MNICSQEKHLMVGIFPDSFDPLFLVFSFFVFTFLDKVK